MLSLESIRPSPFPPFAGLSNSARARKPFLATPCIVGCGLRLPNNSIPLSMIPLPLRSKASQASSEPADVQARRSATPLASKSKLTPPAALVRSNPLPNTSNKIGVSVHCPEGEAQQHCEKSQPFGGSQ